MTIGIDLDNTIISYDELFHVAALEQKLISPNIPAKKTNVKLAIQATHGNDAWTRLQAAVYGPLLERAQPYPGVIDFLRACHTDGVIVRIISHKSQFPALGDRYDLREAAFRWLRFHGLMNHFITGLSRHSIEFHDTRSGKVRAIGTRRCEIFIDDLAEVLTDKAFPLDTIPILFDPHQTHPNFGTLRPAQSWAEVRELVWNVMSA